MEKISFSALEIDIITSSFQHSESSKVFVDQSKKPTTSFSKGFHLTYKARMRTRKGIVTFSFTQTPYQGILIAKNEIPQELISLISGKLPGKPQISWRVSGLFSTSFRHLWGDTQKEVEATRSLLEKLKRKRGLLNFTKIEILS
jgi:hypothetical protein